MNNNDDISIVIMPIIFLILLAIVLLTLLSCSKSNSLMPEPNHTHDTIVSLVDQKSFNIGGELFFLSDSNLLFTGPNSRIMKITPSGVISTFSNASVGMRPYLITRNKKNVFIMDNYSGIFFKITPSGVVSVFARLTGYLPYQIIADTIGNIFMFGDFDGIFKITPDGVVSVFASIKNIKRMTIDALGNIYVASFSGNIFKITPDGVVSVFASIGYNRYPVQIVMIQGNLYTLNDNYSLTKITPDGVVSTFQYSFFGGIMYSDGEYIYIIDMSNKIYILSQSGKLLFISPQLGNFSIYIIYGCKVGGENIIVWAINRVGTIYMLYLSIKVT